MSTPQSEKTDSLLLLTSADIYRAADEGVLSRNEAERLVEWGYEQRFNRLLTPEPSLPSPEQRKGLNLVTVAYYFGAMLMISACAWFLGDKWEKLGSPGIFITTLIYMAASASLGQCSNSRPPEHERRKIRTGKQQNRLRPISPR